MPIYEYKARTKSGELRSGIIETVNEGAALELLQRNELTVLAIKAQISKKNLFDFRINLTKRVKTQDLLIFTRQLATLFEARIPIIQSLKTLAAETKKVATKSVVSKILEDITGGLTLSQAMAKHPEVFSSFYVSLVRSGEESGKLQETLSYLAEYIERNYYFMSKARNAMIYPAFVLSAFVGVVIVMLIVVVPKILVIFEETGQPMPFYTIAIAGISIFLRRWGPALLILLVMGGITFWRWSLTPAGKMFLSQIQLEIPIIGELFKKIYMARFAENLRTLIISGIPIVRALVITKDIIGNQIYQKTITESIESIKAGGTLSSALERSPEVPQLITQMIRIGETSGELDFILGKIAKFYEREVELLIENLVALIEPVLIVVLGSGIGLLIVSILVPLYNLVGTI